MNMKTNKPIWLLGIAACALLSCAPGTGPSLPRKDGARELPRRPIGKPALFPSRDDERGHRDHRPCLGGPRSSEREILRGSAQSPGLGEIYRNKIPVWESVQKARAIYLRVHETRRPLKQVLLSQGGMMCKKHADCR